MFEFNQDDPQLPGAQPGLLPAPATAVEELEETHVTGEGWAVILFNDEAHSMDEVAMQIVLATGCPWENATEIMMRAHQHGQAIVTITHQQDAERIASILRRIALRVTVEQV